jgi:hypothetical protein
MLFYMNNPRMPLSVFPSDPRHTSGAQYFKVLYFTRYSVVDTAEEIA